MLVTFSKLITDVGGDAGFDSSCAESDESESGEEPELHHATDSHKSEGEVAEAVNGGEFDDRVVFSPVNICNPGT